MSATEKVWVNNSAPTCEDDDLNGFKNENNNLIIGSGQSLNTGDLQQTHKAVAQYSTDGDFFTESGSTNAYVLSAPGARQPPVAYTDGMIVRFETANANTAASTINVGGLGVKSILVINAGDIDGLTTLRFDLSQDGFILVPTGIGYNLLDNPERIIDQDGFGLGQPAAGVRGADRWFGDGGGNQIEQTVLSVNIQAAIHTISWEGGTGTATVDGNSGLNSGDTVTLAAGLDISVIVPTDADKMKLEIGGVATPYIRKDINDDTDNCLSHYWVGNKAGMAIVFWPSADNTTSRRLWVKLPVRMHNESYSVVFGGPTGWSASPTVTAANKHQDSFVSAGTASATTTQGIVTGFTIDTGS